MPAPIQFLVGSFATRFLATSVPLSANAAILSKMESIITPIRVTQAHIMVLVTNGNVDVGIYELRGATMVPLATSGSTAVGPANLRQTLTLSNPVWLLPDHIYYAGIAPDNAVAALAGWSSDANVSPYSAYIGLVYRFNASFPLPVVPFAIAALGDYRAPGIWFD